MSRIFQSATEVLVWLGPSADDSDNLMRKYTEIGNMADDFNLGSYLSPERIELLSYILSESDLNDPATVRFRNLTRRLVEILDKDTVLAMVALEKRSWFSRVWVLQEYALARSASYVCGNMMMPCASLELARDAISFALQNISRDLRPFTIPLFQNPISMFSIARRLRLHRNENVPYQDGLSVYDTLRLLCTIRPMQAAFACDRIYGVLRVATDAEKLGLEPDYALRDRVDFIFARVTRALVLNGDSDIFSMVQYPKVQMHLPSWVPDFTSFIQAALLPRPQRRPAQSTTPAQGLILKS